MALAAANRRYDALHKSRPYHDGTFTVWTKEPTEQTPFHARDGVRIWVSRHDLTPEDDFLSPPHLSGGMPDGDPPGEGRS